MPLQTQPLTPAVQQHLKDIFEDVDLSIIQDVLYLDAWNTHEEHGGILIFTGIDGTIQYCEFGYCVMAPMEQNSFNPYEIPLWQAQEFAQEMDNAIEQNQHWWSYNS